MAPSTPSPTFLAAAAPRKLRRHMGDATTSGGGPRALAVRNITFTSADPKRLADFWAAAAGCTQRRDSAEEVLLALEDWRFPCLSFQHSATPRSGPGRVHLDLTAADMAAEVDRLIGPGATKLWRIDVAQSGTTTWTTMGDPDGNEFCVVQQPPGD